MKPSILKILLVLGLIIFLTPSVYCSKVEIVKEDGNYKLLRDGSPYYINGAGGSQYLERLSDYGGNSIRTWGVDEQTDQLLEKAHKLNLSVCFGIWIGQERQGFDYSNKQALEAQLEMVRLTVRKYKDHPSILLWGVGNEMDLDYSNFDVWKHMEEVIKIVKQEDPDHPTMIVTAGLDVAEIKLIQKYTPSLDILGINTYGNISYIPDAIDMYGWNKPYIIAEWGPYGWWEVPKTKWGAAIEETSTEKMHTYKASLESISSSDSKCLGSYVFLWGQKQETTSTWFGLFTQEGEETEVMDMLMEAWSGEAPENKSPGIKNFKLNLQKAADNISVKVYEKLTATVEIEDPDGDAIQYVWQVIPESKDKKTGGDKEKAPKALKGVFTKKDQTSNTVTFSISKPGQYRLFLFAKDGNANVATGNIPFKITE